MNDPPRDEHTSEPSPVGIPPSMTFNNPEIVSSLFHEQKQQILTQLVQHERTIYDLKTDLKLNPGIIKRHIDDLLEKGLIIQTRTGTNAMGMNLKYYRAITKKFIVHLEWEP